MLNKLRNNEDGFTLIELLVVILIIGILAAIALPTFLGQRDKAQDSSAKSDVRNAVTQMESCLVDSTFTACNTSNAANMPEGVTATANGTTEGAYHVTALSDSDMYYRITKAAPGSYTRLCGTSADGGATVTAATSSTAKGSCPAGGAW